MNEIERKINEDAIRLQNQINEKLKDFQPSVIRHRSMKDEPGIFLEYEPALFEAQGLADLMAANLFEVVVLETFGGPQRFHATVTRYVGNHKPTEDIEYRPDEYR